MQLRKSVLLFVLLLASMPFAMAQTQPAAPPKFDPEKRAEKATERMTQDLQLSPEQAAKVKAINGQYAQKEKTLHDNAQKQHEEKKALLDAKQKEIEQVLTPQQRQKQQAQRQQLEERRNEIKDKRRDEMRGERRERAEKTSNMPPEERAKQMTDRMSKRLQLDEQKTKQLSSINEYFMQRRNKIRQDATLSKEQKMQQMKAAMDEKEQKLKGLLSPEQYQRHQEAVKRIEERRSEMPPRRGRCNKPPMPNGNQPRNETPPPPSPKK